MKYTFNLSILLSFLSIVILVSCDKDPVTPGTPTVNFQSPSIGQENFYQAFAGECGQLVPTGDTLILRIKDVNGVDLEVEELYTEGSPSHSTETYVYPAKWSTSFLDIKPEYRQFSRLFFFYGSDTLRLVQEPDINLQQNNCVLWDGQTDFVGDSIGLVNSFKVGSLEYQDKKIVSCVPIILNLDAYLVYDRHNLYASFASSNGGWEPIENPFVTAYALINIE